MEWEGKDAPALSPEEIERSRQKDIEREQLVGQLRALVQKAPEYGFVPEDLQNQLREAVNKLYKY